MKAAIICSSKTGNTMKIAQAIQAAMPEGTPLFPIAEAPDPAAYDFIIMGFWIDKAAPDRKAKAYMKTLTDKKVFTYFTLGAVPHGDHAQRCLRNSTKAYGKGCTEVGTFHCQGAIDPKLIKIMRWLFPFGPHANTEKNRARWAEAAKHPNQDDCSAAVEAIKHVLQAL